MQTPSYSFKLLQYSSCQIATVIANTLLLACYLVELPILMEKNSLMCSFLKSLLAIRLPRWLPILMELYCCAVIASHTSLPMDGDVLK